MSTRKTKNELAAELDATRTELATARAELAAARAELAAARTELEQLRSRRWAPLDSDVAAPVDRVRGRVRTLEQWGTAVIPPRPDRSRRHRPHRRVRARAPRRRVPEAGRQRLSRPAHAARRRGRRPWREN